MCRSTCSIVVKKGDNNKINLQARNVMVSHLLREQTVCSIPAAPCQPEPAPLGLLTPHTTLTVNEMQYS